MGPRENLKIINKGEEWLSLLSFTFDTVSKQVQENLEKVFCMVAMFAMKFQFLCNHDNAQVKKQEGITKHHKPKFSNTSLQ